MKQPGVGLIIDSDCPSRSTLIAQFDKIGWQVRGCSSLEAAVVEANYHPPHLVITEIRLPVCTELSLLRFIEDLARRSPRPTVVVVTEYPSFATATWAGRNGAVAYLVKPATAAMIMAIIADDTGRDWLAHQPVPPMSLQRAEWEYVCWVLGSCQFNRSRAARLLGIGRRTLQRKLETRPPTR